MATLPPPENSGPANVNPYAPPESALAGAEPLDVGGDLAEAEATRRAFLSHEASVKSIGSLHYIAAFFCCFLVTIRLISFLVLRVQPDRWTMLFFGFFTGFYLILSGLHLTLGIGLTRLQSWARWTDVVLLLISLLFLLLAAGGAVLVSLMNPNAAGAIVRHGMGMMVYG